MVRPAFHRAALWTVGVFLIGSSIARAQSQAGEPPVNDLCPGAIDVGAVPAVVLGSNTAALSDILTPCGVDSGPFKNVWYSVIGTGGTLTATVCSVNTAIEDTKMSVFCGDCDARACVTGNDDDCDAGINEFLSTTSWCSIPGEVYLITIGGFDSTTPTGLFELSISDAGDSCGAPISCEPPPPPANDLCADAETVTPGVSVFGNNSSATGDAAPFCGTDPPGHGVWYKVVGNGNELTASTCGAGTDFDTKIQVFCDCDTYTCVDGNDDFCDLQSEVTWCSQSGTTYYIHVGGFEAESGNYEFVVNDSGSACVNPPPCGLPPPTGACCVNGQCIGTIIEAECQIAGGIWYSDEDCATYICFGACCDGTTGLCADNVDPLQCVGDQQTYHDHQSCAELNPPCTQHTGACCDGNTGLCTDDVLPGNCVGDQLTWHKGELCSALNPPCTQHTGACCDGNTGLCADDVLPDNCVGDQLTWHKGELCANLNPPCTQHTGACCDGNTGLCSDDVLPGSCVGDQLTWHKGELCANLSPPCVQHTGACCLTSPGAGGTCVDDVLPQDCTGPQRIWSKGLLCSQVTCEEAAGACCNTLEGTCTENVLLSDCQGPQRQWTKNGSCAGVVCLPASGACCDANTGLCTLTTFADCNCSTCEWTKNATCEEIDCQPPGEEIPTVSQWGLAVLSLLLLIGAKIRFGRRDNAIRT